MTRGPFAFRLADAPVVLGLAWMLVHLLRTVIPRLLFPLDLEWVEGGILVEAWRLRHGLELYVPPSAEFVPSIYPPLYPWLVALLGEPSYLLGRGLSLVATLAAAAAAAVAVRRERLSWGLALGAAALFLSGYDDAGTFYDLVRVDALATGLLAWSLVAARGGGFGGALVGGLLLAGVFATKQSYAAIGAPVAAWLWVYRGWRLSATFVVAAAIPAAVLVVGLQWVSDGWYARYVFDVPRAHPLVGARALTAPLELGRAYAWAAAGALVAVSAIGLPRLARRPRTRLAESETWWIALALTAIPLAALMRAHFGSFTNVLIPALWVLAVAVVVALGRARRHWQRPWLDYGVALLLCVQLWAGAWDRGRHVPTAEERETGERMIRALAAVEGEVFVPHAPWYPRLAGKPPSFTLTALWDLQHPRSPLPGASRVLSQAIAERRWDAIVAPVGIEFGYGLQQHYRRAGALPPDGAFFDTREGWRVRLGEVWVPR